MDKTAIGLLADVLYIKGVICYEEFEAIQEVTTHEDVENFVEKLLRGGFNVYKKGEAYLDYATTEYINK